MKRTSNKCQENLCLNDISKLLIICHLCQGWARLKMPFLLNEDHSESLHMPNINTH